MVCARGAPKPCIFSFSLRFPASVFDGAGLGVMNTSCWASQSWQCSVVLLTPCRAVWSLGLEERSQCFLLCSESHQDQPGGTIAFSTGYPELQMPCTEEQGFQAGPQQHPGCSLGCGSFWVPVLHRCDVTYIHHNIGCVFQKICIGNCARRMRIFWVLFTGSCTCDRV